MGEVMIPVAGETEQPLRFLVFSETLHPQGAKREVEQRVLNHLVQGIRGSSGRGWLGE